MTGLTKAYLAEITSGNHHCVGCSYDCVNILKRFGLFDLRHNAGSRVLLLNDFSQNIDVLGFSYKR